MSSSAFCKLGARRAAKSRRLGRIASFAAALAGVLWAVPPPHARADNVKVQISNFWTWKEAPAGTNVMYPGSPEGRLSVLEQMNVVSRPYVRIENNSSREVVGVQMDMTQWNAKITGVEWSYLPTDGFKATWNWNDAAQSAFFQFGANPLTRGQAVVMRLDTAAKPGPTSGLYNANQTLFSPSYIDCSTNNTGGVCFDVFTNKPGAAFTYSDVGKPLGLGIASTDCLCTVGKTVDINTLANPEGITMECVVPVPEPGTLALAASAAAVLALSCLRRRRTHGSAAQSVAV